MKKRTGNHTKTAAITAIALTAAVMAPAMTMRNTRGAQQENPSVSLEDDRGRREVSAHQHRGQLHL